MQQHFILTLIVSSLPVFSSKLFSSSAAEAWLEVHQAPTEGQLGELAQANPQAFAIVSALLSKHKKSVTLAPEDRGPDVFRKMMTPSHLSLSEPHVAQPYPELSQPYTSTELAEVQPPVIDQAHYDAKQTYDKDGSMVDKILEMAASMGGAKGKKLALLRSKHKFVKQEAEDPFAKDKDLFAEDAPATRSPTQAPAQAIPTDDQVTVASTRQGNSYLKGIDLSGDMPKVVQKSGAKEIDVQTEASDSSSSLSTFSFGDEVPTTAAPKKVVKPQQPKENAFLKWLGVVHKAPSPTEAPMSSEKAVIKQNSYLAKFMS